MKFFYILFIRIVILGCFIDDGHSAVIPQSVDSFDSILNALDVEAASSMESDMLPSSIQAFLAIKEKTKISDDVDARVGEFLNVGLSWMVKQTKSDVFYISEKWRLSGIGDGIKNDDWLRLMDKDDKGFYGGLATDKLFTNRLYVQGQADTQILYAEQKLMISKFAFHPIYDKYQNQWLKLADWDNSGLFGGILAERFFSKELTVTDLGNISVLQSDKVVIGSTFKLEVRDVPGTLFLGSASDQYKDEDLGLNVGFLRAISITASNTGNFKNANVQQFITIKNGVRLTAVGNSLQVLDATSKISAFANITAKNLTVNDVTGQGATFASVDSGYVGIGGAFKLIGQDGWLRLVTPDASSLAPLGVGSLYSKSLAVDGNAIMTEARIDTLYLGKSFRLSGLGDGIAKDEYLRLMAADNKTLAGGFAAGKLYSDSLIVTTSAQLKNLTVSGSGLFSGDVKVVGNLDVDGTTVNEFIVEMRDAMKALREENAMLKKALM